MANSIQTALLKSEKDSKYANIIASVILTLRSNVTEGKIVVVVEGADDCRLYERMYDAKFLNSQLLVPLCRDSMSLEIMLSSMSEIAMRGLIPSWKRTGKPPH